MALTLTDFFIRFQQHPEVLRILGMSGDHRGLVRHDQTRQRLAARPERDQHSVLPQDQRKAGRGKHKRDRSSLRLVLVRLGDFSKERPANFKERQSYLVRPANFEKR
jgi:hypothetical protein